MNWTALATVLVIGLGVQRFVYAEEPAPIPAATTQQVEQTVERAARYLQAECGTWLDTKKCAACHHAGLPLWALAEAGQQGYSVDKKFVTDRIESLLGSKDKLLASRIFPNPADKPDPRPQGRGLNMGLPFLVVAARALPSLEEGQKESLKLIAEEIVKKQQPDGSWEFFATLRRPPINESQTTDAAWIILALEGETGADAPETQRAALAKGIAWLEAAKPTDLHQDKAFKVLLAARAGQPREKMQTTIDELFALQRSDGGWSQTVPEPKERRLCHGPNPLRSRPRRLHRRAPRNQAGHQLSRHHPESRRQLAHDFSLDPRWFSREFETADPHQLRCRFVGRAGIIEARAQESLNGSSWLRARRES